MRLPQAVVVHIGCGLDSRFERVDNGTVVWYDLDLPDFAELVFDAFSPFLVMANNLRLSLTKFGARYYWGLKRGKDLETWGSGICLLDEWGYFDRPEPRLAHVRWIRHVPLLSRVLRIYHYKLGKPAGGTYSD